MLRINSKCYGKDNKHAGNQGKNSPALFDLGDKIQIDGPHKMKIKQNDHQIDEQAHQNIRQLRSVQCSIDKCDGGYNIQGCQDMCRTGEHQPWKGFVRNIMQQQNGGAGYGQDKYLQEMFVIKKIDDGIRGDRDIQDVGAKNDNAYRLFLHEPVFHGGTHHAKRAGAGDQDLQDQKRYVFFKKHDICLHSARNPPISS